MISQNNEYQIHLPQFEGPFDLLLFFIERDELDIRDIPISKITYDFLEYLHHLEQQALDIASEFLVMAARLIKIKANMLLPSPALHSEVATDPRTELVDRLVEYKRFKLAIESLEKLESLSNLSIKRGFVAHEVQILKGLNGSPKEELYGLTLYELSRVFHKLIQKMELRQTQPKHVIQKFPYTVEEVKEQVLSTIKVHKKVEFIFFLKLKNDRLFAVFCFLIILELIQQRIINVIVGEGYNNFWLLDKQEVERSSS
ncbi:MAG: segregation/condensation protein A [Bacteroidia bacterium]|nr:segregation/condensation protein A [Bacteroidia bacterium]MDW8158570.1 segregation/condensation protein A [Bacteroidia bacterium]